MNLIAKIKIHGELTLETGLHIGGSKSELNIGGIDLSVIKLPGKYQIPFIPGSSIKGKLRSLLAKTQGSIAISKQDIEDQISELKTQLKEKSDKKQIEEKLDKTQIEEKLKFFDDKTSDEDYPFFFEIFGTPGNIASLDKGRLLIRDANLNLEHFKKNFPDLYKKTEAEKEFIKFTEIKTENVIDRKTGTALHPRQIERVPAGAVFGFEMIYDVYNDNKKSKHLALIQTAMNLLEYDYLGGNGSRGYGRITFKNVNADYYKIENDTFDKEPDTEKSIENFLETEITD